MIESQNTSSLDYFNFKSFTVACTHSSFFLPKENITEQPAISLEGPGSLHT